MAKEFYGYFDSTSGDRRQYRMSEFAAGFQVAAGTGVGHGLEVDAAGGMDVQLRPGGAMISGYTYLLTDDGGNPKTLTLENSAATERIDRIILRLNLTAGARKITAEVRQGAPGANPQPPELTQTAAVKEISLCKVRVRAGAIDLTAEDIEDERLDPEVCGVLTAGALQAAYWDMRYASKAEAAVFEQTLSQALADTTRELGGSIDENREAIEANASRISVMTAGKAEVSHYYAAFPAAGWTNTEPYTQTVEVLGLSGLMAPIADAYLDDDPEIATAQKEAWGFFGKLETGTDSLTAICYEDKPEVDVEVKLMYIGAPIATAPEPEPEPETEGGE